MMKYIFILMFTGNSIMAQTDDLPYHKIPDAPVTYTAGTVASRTIDGLGYRYYWATEGLRPEDLDYKISEDSRAAGETIDHILGLSSVILNGIESKPNERRNDPKMDFDAKRKATLINLYNASKIIRNMSDVEVANCTIIFKRGENTNEFPLWNLLNGPIADAIYHTGQIVSYRRASGNPLPSGVSVFTGITRE
jgi:uncharacterized damage-inducible protein DinB